MQPPRMQEETCSSAARIIDSCPTIMGQTFTNATNTTHNQKAYILQENATNSNSPDSQQWKHMLTMPYMLKFSRQRYGHGCSACMTRTPCEMQKGILRHTLERSNTFHAEYCAKMSGPHCLSSYILAMHANTHSKLQRQVGILSWTTNPTM